MTGAVIVVYGQTVTVLAGNVCVEGGDENLAGRVVPLVRSFLLCDASVSDGITRSRKAAPGQAQLPLQGRARPRVWGLQGGEPSVAPSP